MFDTGRYERRWVSTLGAAALFGLVMMVTHSFASGLTFALLPRIEESLGVGYGVLGLVLSITMAAYAAGTALTVKLLDLLPPRGLLILCIVVCGLGSLVLSTASSAWLLALCTGVIGISAAVSWSALSYMTGECVDPRYQGSVVVVGGVAAGVGKGINGVLVWVLAAEGEWRAAFAGTAVLAVCAVAVALAVFRRPVDRPLPAAESERGAAGLRRIWSSAVGRVVILGSLMAGVGGVVFAAYLSEIAINDLGVSPLAAAVPWWLTSAAAVISALPVGLMGDRGSPVGIVSVITGVFTASLVMLAVWWSYPALILAALGFGVFYFPIWAKLWLAAHKGLSPPLAVRAVSIGGVAGQASAAVGIAAAGAWIEATGSFRITAAVQAVIIGAAVIWFRQVHLLSRRLGPFRQMGILLAALWIRAVNRPRNPKVPPPPE